MVNIEEDINKRYAEVKVKYDLADKDLPQIQEMLDTNEYVIFLCHKIHKWLGIDMIHKTVNYYKELCCVMDINDYKIEDVPESCQVIITAAKYYVKGVYATKRVYNL